jgi:hypothetical protein
MTCMDRAGSDSATRLDGRVPRAFVWLLFAAWSAFGSVLPLARMFDKPSNAGTARPS